MEETRREGKTEKPKRERQGGESCRAAEKNGAAMGSVVARVKGNGGRRRTQGSLGMLQIGAPATSNVR